MSETAWKYIETYLQFGWKVIPCIEKGKTPLIDRWPERATGERQIIDKWMNQWPNANIGLVQGNGSGTVVVDIDEPRGGGDAWWDASKGAITTPTVLTAHGRHLYFKHPLGSLKNAVDILPGIDIRSDGGYVIAPWSLHPDGVRYEWESDFSPLDVPLAEFPADLFVRREQTPVLFPTDKSIAPLTPGLINTTLTAIAGDMRRHGVTPEGIKYALIDIYKTRAVGDTERWETRLKEIEAIVAQSSKWTASDPYAFGISQPGANLPPSLPIVTPTIDENLNILRKYLNLPIEKVVKRGSYEPEYELHVQGKIIVIGSAKKILSQLEMKAAVFAALDIILPPIERTVWPKICEAVGKAVETIETSTLEENIAELVRFATRPGAQVTYWTDENDEKQTGEAMRRLMSEGYVIDKEGRYLLTSLFVRSRIKSEFNLTVSNNQMAIMLTRLGFTKERLRRRVDGIIREVRYWRSPEDFREERKDPC